jgi:hypothetical protein
MPHVRTGSTKITYGLTTDRKKTETWHEFLASQPIDHMYVRRVSRNPAVRSYRITDVHMYECMVCEH